MSEHGHDLDLDLGRVQVNGEWLTAEDLTTRITEQVRAGNYRVARLSLALEALEEAMATQQTVEVRLPRTLLAPLERMAEADGRPLGYMIRWAVGHYLGSEDAANRLYALARPAEVPEVDAELGPAD